MSSDFQKIDDAVARVIDISRPYKFILHYKPWTSILREVNKPPQINFCSSLQFNQSISLLTRAMYSISG